MTNDVKSPPFIIDIFLAFLRLGCTSFGGPAAHLVYFQREFVDSRQWLNNATYERLLAISHFLPGPSSSQVGFGIGYHCAGVGGGVAAFLGFTLPSALLLLLLFFISGISDAPLMALFQEAVKLLLVIVVADALLTMGKRFCQRSKHLAIAVTAGLILLLFSGVYLQLFVLIIAAVIGYCGDADKHNKKNESPEPSTPKQNPAAESSTGLWALALFAVGLGLSLLLINGNGLLALASGFYQAGSLVFGGGHVVLPLLEDLVASQLSSEQFLLGYGAAQTIPGPVFSVATYLGAALYTEQPVVSAIMATVAIFLPGFLLLLSCYHQWEAISQRPGIPAAIAAVNAAVVGLLAAAFISPVVTSSIGSITDLFLVVIGFIALTRFKVPVLLVLALLLISLGLS